MTFEQSYPAPATEQKILEGVALDLGVEDRDFCSQLVNSSDVISKTFYDGGIDEIISTPVWFILSVLMLSSKIKQKQFRFVSTVLMPKPSKHFLELYDKIDVNFELPKEEKTEPELVIETVSY